MNYNIIIPAQIERAVRGHLFQNRVEQGAFLFARIVRHRAEMLLEVEDGYLIPAEGWRVQTEIHLEMHDAERARIMKLARDKGLAIVDCHSHIASFEDVAFSPSDIIGITEFAAYAKWKLDGKPYAAIIWGELSVDAVIWVGDFRQAQRVRSIIIRNGGTDTLIPRGSWFSRRSRL